MTIVKRNLVIFYSFALDCKRARVLTSSPCAIWVHISLWYLKFECRDTWPHTASRAAFYGSFIVGTKLITPRGSPRIVAFVSSTPCARAREGGLFIKSHISRARRRLINLPWRFLLWRRAKLREEKRKRESERERERNAREPSIFYANGDSSLRRDLFYFHIRPRVTNVTGVRRRRKHLRPETCVWIWILSVWESVTSQSNGWKIFILKAQTPK